MKYYVSYQNAVYGPYSPKDMTSFLTPGTLVCREGENVWHSAKDIDELNKILERKGKIHVELTTAPETSYYVQKNNKEYGPYSIEQLKEFVKPSTKIRISTEKKWKICDDLAELHDFFRFKGETALKGWFYYDEDDKEHGPYSKKEILKLIKNKGIKIYMRVQHISWSNPVKLEDTKLYKDYQNPPQEEIHKNDFFSILKSKYFIISVIILITISFLISKSINRTRVIQKAESGNTNIEVIKGSENIIPPGQITGEIFKKIPVTAASNNLLLVTMIDVGQGDGFVIQTPSKKVYIIDAGPRWQGNIVPFLKKNNVTEIEAIMLSHPHQDHLAEFESILDAFPVKKAYDSSYQHTSRAYRKLLQKLLEKNVKYIKSKAGDVYDWGDGIKIEVFHPDKPKYRNINNNSIVFKLIYRNNTVLFTGDAEREAENLILSKYADKLQSDILKVGHHGSRTSTTAPFLDAVNPKIAMISCGVRNKFRHPHPSVVKRIEDRGIKIYRTDKDGFVTFAGDGSTWKVIVEENLYDKIKYEFPEKPSYSIEFTDLNFLNDTKWSSYKQDVSQVEIIDGALTISADVKESIYSSPPNCPIIFKSVPSLKHWTAVIRMAGSVNYKTNSSILLFSNNNNWLSLNCEESRKFVNMTNCVNGKKEVIYFDLKRIPSYYAIEKFDDKLNIAVSSDFSEWYVIKRFTESELGIQLSNVRIGLSANSWGNQRALATFFEYKEWSQ